MITNETIQEQIVKLTAEETTLRSNHDKLIREHQQRTQRVQEIVNANVSRMQQITGSIATLKQLLNGAEKPPTEENEPT